MAHPAGDAEKARPFAVTEICPMPAPPPSPRHAPVNACLLYTSDAADE